MTGALKIVRIGPIAAETLAADGDAEVSAVFERSAVVMTSHGFVTLGGESLGDGPLNVLLPGAPGPLDWIRWGVTREAKGAVRGGVLHLGKTFSVDVRTAPVWQPPPWPAVKREAIAASLAAVRAMDRSFWPTEGLSRLVIAGDAAGSDRSARAAAPTIAELRHTLPDAIASGRAGGDLIRAATLLIGLGPGLTPSGDDLLGGLFLSLSALGHVGLRDQLWAALAPEMELLTTGLSGAHVAAAADGLAGASVHAALAALLTHDAVGLPAHLAALRAIGHCSGCDTLAGMVLGLEGEAARL